MFDALFTVAVYAAIAMGLLWAALMIGAVVLAVVDHIHDEVVGYDEVNAHSPLEWESVDETSWEDWDWPIPDDLNAWNLPKSEFED